VGEAERVARWCIPGGIVDGFGPGDHRGRSRCRPAERLAGPRPGGRPRSRDAGGVQADRRDVSAGGRGGGTGGGDGGVLPGGGLAGPTGTGQITAPPTTAAPRAQPVLPSVPAVAPVTVAAPATTPAAPVSTPEASVAPEAPVMTPAAPPPVELAPSSPSHRSAGGSTEERAAAVPAPHPPGHSGGDEQRQDATSQDQPPPAAATPDSPDPTSAPEGFTRVPYKPWKPPAPQ
jgi:hypothetical protein